MVLFRGGRLDRIADSEIGAGAVQGAAYVAVPGTLSR